MRVDGAFRALPVGCREIRAGCFGLNGPARWAKSGVSPKEPFLMCRTLLLPLVVVGLALGLPFVRDLGAGGDGRVSASLNTPEGSGLLVVSDAVVPFTVFWPKGTLRGGRPVVIFAADAQARRPLPLRQLARAAAAAGVAAVYIAPSEAPDEAARRLTHVLSHQAAAFDVDADSVFTWVEGHLFGGGHLLGWALERTLGAACSF
jgi:hypothetical protein